MAMASLKRKEAELVYDPLSDFSLLSQMKKIKSMDDELPLMLIGEEEDQTFPSPSLLRRKEILQHLLPQFFVQNASDLLPEIIQTQDEWQVETRGDAEPMDHKLTAISPAVISSQLPLTGTRNEFIDDLMDIEESEEEFSGVEHATARIFWTGLF